MQKRSKEDKKTNFEREKKKKRSPLRLSSINHHKTHTFSHTIYIFKTPWASRSRNCSSASFRRRKCAFWWCAEETFWFFGRFSGFFLSLFHFFSTARIFAFVGRKSSEGEERFLNRDDDFCARVSFLLNVPRLDAKRARGRMRRVYVRAIWTHRSIESILAGKTWNQPRISSVRFQSACDGGVPLSPKNFGSLLRERRDVFRVDFSTDSHLSFFTINAEHTHRLVSMPPVKLPSYTNLSSEKSWRRFRPSVRFRFSSFASLRTGSFPLVFFCLVLLCA